MDTATKIGLDAIKTASKTLVATGISEATGEAIENKIADKIVKTKPLSNMNLRNVKVIVIQPETREEILNKLKQIL